MDDIEMELWWDKGLLWIHTYDDTICLNSYQAAKLLEKLQNEKERIDAQVVIDKSEGL